MGRPKKTISEIVTGKARLTDETALELQTVLGIPAAVWSNLQHAYDRFMATEAHAEQLETQTELLKIVPVREMVKMGWVAAFSNRAAQLRAVLEFFAVSSLAAWRAKYEKPVAAFRASDKSKIGARAAWYRKAELELDGRVAGFPEYNPTAFKEALGEIRGLTRESTDQGFARAVEICRRAGVVLIMVRELPGAGVSGATIWRNKTPGIVLTLRFKSDDQLWFSFMHEAGHVLLHRGQIFLEVEAKAKSTVEREADRFAADILIPPQAFSRLKQHARFSSDVVRLFADQEGVCPGVVVGRLQHDGLIPLSQLNGFKRKLQWAA
jgi:plasmid maintenance system antidote protein VapI/Zn-dependent peptidase ImmA (M78 family)